MSETSIGRGLDRGADHWGARKEIYALRIDARRNHDCYQLAPIS
jgi:hypothetical protein